MKPLLKNKQECVGCGACRAVCPNEAITMQKNTLGFLYPSVSEKLCVSCFLCEKVCDSVAVNFKSNTPKEYYSYKAGNEIRIQSSSGGFFTLAGDYALNNNYYVCGAVFDNNFKDIKLIVSDKKEDLLRMRKSKYVATSTEDVYKEIGRILKDNEKVLFFGLPCQVSGLKAYLSAQKLSEENLVMVDLLCHGSGAPLIYQFSLKDFCRQKGAGEDALENVDFRPKPEFKEHSIEITLQGEKNRLNSDDFPYYLGFNNKYLLRESCYGCNFKSKERQGDLTIGDMVPATEDNLGQSLVTVNTEKGKDFAKKIGMDKLCFKLSEEEKVITDERFNHNDKMVHPYRKKMEIKKEEQYNALKKTFLNKSYIPFKYKVKRFLKKVLNLKIITQGDGKL